MTEWRIFPDETIKLINNYKQFECLWNYKSASYKRIDLKKNAWLQLAKEFGKNVEEVKKKMKYLRTAYVSEKKKVDQSKKSGSSTDDIYRSHLFYFDEFSFLNSVIVLRPTSSTFDMVNIS